MTKMIDISNSFNDGLKYRFKKYFRFNNSVYWKRYYQEKLKSKDVGRERMYAKIIYNYISFLPSPKVLDIGSGFGFLLKEISSLGVQSFGVDLFVEMLNEAKNYLKGSNVKLQKADILDLPFEENYFDCIVLMSVIEHLAIQEVENDILGYVRKFIKPNGYLFIHVPVRSFYSVFARLFRKYILKDLPNWAIDDDGDVTHKMWLSYNEYIEMIEKCGFELVNYDFRTTRSNLKPKIANDLMSNLQNILDNSDPQFKLTYANESFLVKSLKKFKSTFALTSYFLFRKVE